MPVPFPDEGYIASRMSEIGTALAQPSGVHV